MRSDPEPGDDIAVAQTERTIMFPDADHANAVTALFEMERRMISVPLP
jgi:hypothetical protein